MAAIRMNASSATVALALALVGVLLLGSVGSAPAHTFRARSTVSIKFSNGQFHGRVRSPRPSCKKKRLVKVWKARTVRKDIFIGSTRTDLRGRWSVPKPAEQRGAFYAKVQKRTRGRYEHLHRCRYDLSPVIRVGKKRGRSSL